MTVVRHQKIRSRRVERILLSAGAFGDVGAQGRLKSEERGAALRVDLHRIIRAVGGRAEENVDRIHDCMGDWLLPPGFEIEKNLIAASIHFLKRHVP